MKELSLTVHNPSGLHARPAKVLAKLAKKYGSDISIKHGQKEANAKSMISILKLGVKSASDIQLIVDGEDEMEASLALEEAFRSGLGEGPAHSEPKAVSAPSSTQSSFSNGHSSSDPIHVVKGLAASPGIAIGGIRHLHEETFQITDTYTDAESEIAALEEGLVSAVAEIKGLHQHLLDKGIQNDAEIFEAHLEIINDADMLSAVKNEIKSGLNGPKAWKKIIDAESQKLAELDDPTLAARSADIQDVGNRLLHILLGSQPEQNGQSEPETPYIICAVDLSPSQTATLNPAEVCGILTQAGGPTAHSAILARALGIPAVVGAGRTLESLPNGQVVILNGSKGTLNSLPTADELTTARQQIDQNRIALEAAQRDANQSATTLDGFTVEIGGNGGSIDDAEAAFEAGADGIGLLRTEFLFLGRSEAPDQETQFKIYSGITEKMQGRTVIFRTLDIGGDKPVPYIKVPHEENPFLGERGIRLQINRPEILRTQLRALLETAKSAPLRIMFPMVGQLKEWRIVRQIVEEVRQEVGAPEVEIGIMIEIPSAAVMANVFAAEVDFFSIGTNDLTQYTLAIDRQHPTLTAHADGLDPAVLRLIKMTVDGAKAHGKWVGVCGELGSDPQAAPILIGLGVDELSVNVKAVPRVKAQVRSLALADCQILADKALRCHTSADVRQLQSVD